MTNGPVCTRNTLGTYIQNVHLATRSHKLDRIAPTSIRNSHLAPLVRSDLFRQRKRFCVPAWNKRSSSRFRSLNYPPLSSSSLSSFSLLLSYPHPGSWLGPRNYNFDRMTTPRRTYSRSRAIHPFQRCARAPCSNYFIFRQAVSRKTDSEDRKVTVKID